MLSAVAHSKHLARAEYENNDYSIYEYEDSLLKYTVLYNLFREVAVTATNTRQEFGQSYSMCLC
jgi:hypothetical protein